MKRVFANRIALLLLALVPAGLAGSPALAQDVTGERVRQAIEQTDARIELATSLVAESNNASAEAELSASVSLQSQAKDVYGQALTAVGEIQIRMLRHAADLTLRARGRADRVIALIRGLPDPDRVGAQVERTRALIERARDRIEECDSDRARALLRVAVEMQGRAEAALREGRFTAALQLTLSARERAMRALRMCNVKENLEESAERAIQRTDAVLDRAKDIVADCDAERAREMLARSVRLQAEAKAQFRSGHFEASIRMTMSARNLAIRAIRMCEGRSGGGEGRVREGLSDGGRR